MEYALFPYDEIRDSQREMLESIAKALEIKKNVIIHAPTGLGKTAAALAPCLDFALKNKLTVFFLTSRHTQHLHAITTLRDIKKKHGIKFTAVDIVSKRLICPVEGIDILTSSEFSEYCKKQKEDSLCEFYLKTRINSKLTPRAEKTLSEMKVMNPCSVEECVDLCREHKLCAYEILIELAKKADVIVADYNYIFDPMIMGIMFRKIEKEIGKCVVIVDEAHNLPKRVRDSMSTKLSTTMLDRAKTEAKRFSFNEITKKLEFISDVIEDLAFEQDGHESLVGKNDFFKKIIKKYDYESLAEEISVAGDEIRKQQKKSYLGSIALFLRDWLNGDDGFVRIIEHYEFGGKEEVTLNYKCLDPSIVTKEVIANSYITILMSGTMNPCFMYRDILGFENTEIKEFPSPFPEKNKLSLIIPETTTKYSMRTNKEFGKIADICKKIINSVKGNIAFFFPSYRMRDDIYRYLYTSEITFFLEKQKMTKNEKEILLQEFKAESTKGSVLLAVSNGSFGEGIDLPGELLKAVVIVGLPLEKPSLEIKKLIEYYQKKYSKGMEYGYIYPAMIRVLQNAGRCIRTEHDRGVVIFLDERFASETYKNCFPKKEPPIVTKLYVDRIKEFFSKA